MSLFSGFSDELEKIALSGTTVWGKGESDASKHILELGKNALKGLKGAYETRVVRKMLESRRNRWEAENLVLREHPVYKKWLTRTISHWAGRK